MYADVVFREEPAWSREPGRRLALNLLPATLIVAAVLMSVRLPEADYSAVVTELVVRILSDEKKKEPEPPPPETLPEERPPPPPLDRASPVPQAPAGEVRKPIDWYAQMSEAARAVTATPPREYSVNPGFEERRRAAAEQFAPSRAPVERPIWENVEKDTLGRTLLRSGDCYRVIDDPNVGSRDAFLTFGQFMVTCSRESDKPKKLPWVSELQNRREAPARSDRPAAE